MTEPDEDEEGPEPLETGACLILAGIVFAALCVLGDWLRFMDSIRRWL